MNETSNQNLDNNEDEDKITARDEAMFEARLRAAVHRQDCPDIMELGEYQLGMLTAPDMARTEAHLRHCPYCQTELSQLAEFLAEDSPVFDPVPANKEGNWIAGQGLQWRQIQETGGVMIRLLADALNAALVKAQQTLHPPLPGRLALGGVRGQTHQPVFKAALKEGIEDFETTVIIEISRQEPHRCRIKVEVNIPSWGGRPYLRGTEVILRQGEQQMATQITDPFGWAVFEGIATAELEQFSLEIILQPSN